MLRALHEFGSVGHGTHYDMTTTDAEVPTIYARQVTYDSLSLA